MTNETMTLIQTLEAMNWSPYKEITTDQGPMRVKRMTPSRDFWALWKSIAQTEMKRNGYTMQKDAKGNWWALRFVERLSEAAKARLLEESRAEDTDVALMVPQGLAYRPFQRGGVKYCTDRLFGQHGQRQRHAVLIGDDMGLGKLQQISCQTLTPSGWRKIGELVVGDQVINSEGMASTVTGVFPQGVKPIYEVGFSDGVKTNCGLEHLWEVRDDNMAQRGRGWTVMTLGQMMKRGLKLKSGENKFEIPQFPGHIETHGAAPEIDGWLLGQLIGNGSTGGKDSSIMIASNADDVDIIARLNSCGGAKESRIEGCTRVYFPIYSAGRLMDELRRLDVNCKSKEKSLHASLLVTPWEYRVNLLQGLMDADGSNNKNRITYHTCAPKLAEDVAQLVRSLGGAAVVREYDRSAEGKPTEWQVNVHTQFCPFWSTRKAEGWKADSRSRGNKIESARYLRDEEAVCIMVDHPKHLYVTEGYKLTHNTVQAIGILNQDHNLRDIRAAVICPASLKLNWRNEMRKWLLEGLGSEVIVVKDKWPGALTPGQFLIVNYDVLHKWENEMRRAPWDYLIFDEAHYLKTETTRRTVYALGGAIKTGSIHKLVEPIPCGKKIFLTGTPIPNRVVEIWPIVKECDPNGLGVNKATFVRRYCVNGENGGMNDNLDELQERMRTSFMVRRMKGDVLKELPPKVRSVTTLDPAEYHLDRLFLQEMSIFADYQAVLRTWQIRTELAKAEGIEAHRSVLREKKMKLGMQASELAKMRHKTAIAKVPGVVDQVKMITDEGEKVILFAHHIEVLDKLQEGLEAMGLRVVRVDGAVTLPNRQIAVEAFQAGKADIFLGGIIPAGVGLTLTAATRVVFAELDWVPGQMTQCEDRAHRIGQLETVFILHVVMEGSLDEYMAKRLIEKQEVIEHALDHQASEDLEETEEDADETRDGFAARERAATTGTSAKKLQEESEKMTTSMRAATSAAVILLQELHLKNLNGVDQEILQGLTGDLTALQLALGRKIAWKYRMHLDPSIAKALEWPKPPKEIT